MKISTTWKVDLHVHTDSSYDVFTSSKNILTQCKRKAIDCVAITDHNTIEGALRFQEIADIEVIVGEEIATSEGEIIGLFLTEQIPPKLSPEETISRIKEQKGLVYLPHPIAELCRGNYFMSSKLEELSEDIDVIEVFNARNLNPKSNDRALEFAKVHNLAMGAGSDAHIAIEIGNAYIEMPPFENKEQFLHNLEFGKIYGHRSPLWLRIIANNIVRRGIHNMICRDMSKTKI